MNRQVLSIVVILFLFGCNHSYSQIVQRGKIGGKVVNDSITVEGVHVINKTSKKNTITDEEGFFEIYAQLNDTIVFSAVQFKLKNVIIDQKLVDDGFVEVPMEVRVEELEGVTLYNPLSGDPVFDIKNSRVKKLINFYDLGIPGNTKEPITQSERKFNEAITGRGGRWKWYNITSIPLNPIINGISRRTKMLKGRIKLEEDELQLYEIQTKFEPIFVRAYGLAHEESYRFFLFCSMDEDYRLNCLNENTDVQLAFLITKLREYEKISRVSK